MLSDVERRDADPIDLGVCLFVSVNTCDPRENSPFPASCFVSSCVSLTLSFSLPKSFWQLIPVSSETYKSRVSLCSGVEFRNVEGGIVGFSTSAGGSRRDGRLPCLARLHHYPPSQAHRYLPQRWISTTMGLRYDGRTLLPSPLLLSIQYSSLTRLWIENW